VKLFSAYRKFWCSKFWRLVFAIVMGVLTTASFVQVRSHFRTTHDKSIYERIGTAKWKGTISYTLDQALYTYSPHPECHRLSTYWGETKKLVRIAIGAPTTFFVWSISEILGLDVVREVLADYVHGTPGRLLNLGQNDTGDCDGLRIVLPVDARDIAWSVEVSTLGAVTVPELAFPQPCKEIGALADCGGGLWARVSNSARYRALPGGQQIAICVMNWLRDDFPTQRVFTLRVEFLSDQAWYPSMLPALPEYDDDCKDAS
jgi:hypothetical protein